jgi:hypothetical protein
MQCGLCASITAEQHGMRNAVQTPERNRVAKLKLNGIDGTLDGDPDMPLLGCVLDNARLDHLGPRCEPIVQLRSLSSKTQFL